jgi:flagellar assembly protein FliH
MTSLFEFAGSSRAGEIPVDLIGDGVRDISALQFFTVEEEQRERELADEAPQPDTRETPARERAHQMQAMIDAARADAAAEARRGFEAELETKLDAERERVERVCSEFAMDRQRYFAAAEAQVVKLAIAIARRVLAREVEADPMHLTAIVRAALARVHDATESVLRVPAHERTQWEALFGSGQDGRVAVVGDDRLEPGECVLETNIGRVELGVQVQVGEIERGFADLLRRKGE